MTAPPSVPAPSSIPGAGRAGFQLEPQDQAYAGYAGSASCRECHEEAYELWKQSNHHFAERPLDEALDGAAFSPGRSFTHGTQSTRVFMTNAQCVVTAVGLSGQPEAHSAQRVIGHLPLRQFLVNAPGGRFQTLEAAYDPVTNEWFNVYGNEDRQPGEWGHWTGRGMNWNNMCSSCHNTRVRKNYDVATDSYRTATVEMTVGCEACHGPLKAHGEWQTLHKGTGQKDPTLTKMTRPQILDSCGTCHARRSELTGDFKPGDAFFDHYNLAMVDQSDVYHADGQVRDENFEYASFLSSRMHFRGVHCLDCHNPHSMKTLLPGNWLCLRCHDGSQTNAPLINPVTHSNHRVFGYDTNGVLVDFDLTAYKPKELKETGGECVNCHMPQTAYMQRHWRHDHGFTIPDPLLTKQFGIPNACNRCHQDKTVDWALEFTEKWYGDRMNRPTRTRAQWLARARAGDDAARGPLVEMVRREEIGYWRAAAVEMLSRWFHREEIAGAVRTALDDPDPLVRSKAALVLGPLGGEANSPTAAALTARLADPMRAVRVNAAIGLRLGSDHPSLAAAELQHSLWLNADQPAGQYQLAAHAFARNDLAGAAAHLRKAVDWDPNSAPIRHELAVVLSTMGRSAEALEQIQAACRLAPEEAEYRFKLALAWNETGRPDQARATLEEAVRLDPRHARAWYNLGLARSGAGELAGAIAALLRAEPLAPEDPQVPYARATVHARLGQMAEARTAARRALEIAPQFQTARDLLRQLEAP
ncbi:MAG: tetratricopeptide repeat protein [Limisphaerales bacterium]